MEDKRIADDERILTESQQANAVSFPLGHPLYKWTNEEGGAKERKETAAAGGRRRTRQGRCRGKDATANQNQNEQGAATGVAQGKWHSSSMAPQLAP